jgi:hemerythrin-like domain-containing protein
LLDSSPMNSNAAEPEPPVPGGRLGQEPVSDHTTEAGPSRRPLGRRTLLAVGGAALVAGGGVELANLLGKGPSTVRLVADDHPPASPTAASPASWPVPSQATSAPAIPADVDLMEEHGVLKRLLLNYQEAARQIAAGQTPPAAAINDSAVIMHDFVENLHESLEDGFVFPRLRSAGLLVDTIDTLLIQHARGRQLTQIILAGSTTAGMKSPATRQEVISAMTAFIRMYEPHEAREDTVVFPAFRALLTASELNDVSAIFTDIQRGQLGDKDFDDIVGQVASIEKSLGIYDLNLFTPAPGQE